MILEDTLQVERQNWMSVLAKAHLPSLQKMWSGIQSNYPSEILRKPETGLVMIRARMGGSGAPFNTGEATVTRCSVKNSDGNIGHGYALGRNHTHAKIAAEIDAALQNQSAKNELLKKVIEPLQKIRDENLKENRMKTAATKVDFFTVVRGED